MKIELLDHGYLELIETWGSDERIIESARMSTDKGFLGWGPRCNKCDKSDPDLLPEERSLTDLECIEVGCNGTLNKPGDEKLLRYLWENKHHTPFEMAGATIEVYAPIMVFREWHRHRTQSYNEMSARYIPLPDVNYLPSLDNLFDRSTVSAAEKNKQAQSTTGVEYIVDSAQRRDELKDWLEQLEDVYEHAQQVYQNGLKIGVPKELARLPVPVGRYSKMRASTDLRNWLGFLALRLPTNAQWEIRQYGEAMHKILTEAFPRTLALFNEKER